MRKLLSVLLVMAMCVSLFGCGADKTTETTAPATTAAPVETTAAVETAEATEPAEDIVILYTHGSRPLFAECVRRWWL